MNGGLLPMALLCVAVGLALRGPSIIAFAALVATAPLVALALPDVPPPGPVVIAGLWLSTIVAAALVYVPREMPRVVALALGVNGGAWVGAFAGASGMRGELALALPLGLSFVVRNWFEKRGHVIVIKVIASWLMAIAALALFVSLTPTPGYVPDHME